ncbi:MULTISPECIES: Mur ligase family protein [unclassified Helicobacter]|uniref:Mur ligase family protein n=1 Tax=unclassified Helicobacter TaxID=2593540 RepID=UPI000CF0AF29|nr:MULTISPECIES: Mur ligase family protein [unclassified Helicobacter]
MGVVDFLEAKGQEYARFDPNRVLQIASKLKKILKLPCYKIHIVGTNGKGSTGRYITLGLLENQKKVLHFTSPHLFDFKERYYKNGEKVTQEELEQAHQFLQSFDFIQECSYFEYATFLAFVLAQDVEYLVLEAGLGGEFDSTSCIQSDLSVFTMIGLDHQDFLGNSIEEIATTKLQAMSQLCFLGMQKYPLIEEIARNIASKKKSRILAITQEDIKKYEKILKNISVDFLRQNALTSLKVLDFLKMQLPKEMYPLNLRGRFEKIAPNIIVDVGHNIDSAREIRKILGKKKVNLIFNMYQDKNPQEVLKILKPNLHQVYIFDVKNTRIMPKKTLCEILESLKIKYDDFATLERQKEYLVFGSFSVVEAFLKRYDAR